MRPPISMSPLATPVCRMSSASASTAPSTTAARARSPSAAATPAAPTRSPTWPPIIPRVKSAAGPVAIVTGAGSPQGIGFAIARRLYGAGFHVAIASTTERIRERARELDPSGERVSAHVADLTDEAAAHELVDAVLREQGRVDVLVNNAGLAQTGKA